MVPSISFFFFGLPCCHGDLSYRAVNMLYINHFVIVYNESLKENGWMFNEFGCRLWARRQLLCIWGGSAEDVQWGATWWMSHEVDKDELSFGTDTSFISIYLCIHLCSMFHPLFLGFQSFFTCVKWVNRLPSVDVSEKPSQDKSSRSSKNERISSEGTKLNAHTHEKCCYFHKPSLTPD